MIKVIDSAETNCADMNRKTWADLCRVAAIFGVVVIHACGTNFYQFGKISTSDWLSINLLDSLVRCSVPLFVMLSGALLLSPQDKPATPLQIIGRIRKVAIPLLTWNVAYLLYVSHFTGQAIDWMSMLRQVPMYHLWFVYMIIGLYLLLPVFQAVFAAISKRSDLQRYLLALWLVVTCVPVYYPLPILALVQQTSLLGYAGYFLIGGIVANTHQQSGKTFFWVLVYLAAVLVTFWLTWHFSDARQSVDERAYLYFSPNVFLASLAAFILFTRLSTALHCTALDIRSRIPRIFHACCGPGEGAESSLRLGTPDRGRCSNRSSICFNFSVLFGYCVATTAATQITGALGLTNHAG